MQRIGEVSDLNLDASDKTLAERVAGLNAQGWWPTQLFATSHPYAGDGSTLVQPGDYATTRVGDGTDTSPYLAEKAVIGISTGTYIENMVALIAALRAGH